MFNNIKSKLGVNEKKYVLIDTPLFNKSRAILIDKIKQKHYIEEHKMLQYQIDFINNINENFDLTGKRVLEIGGSNMPRELLFDEFKVKKWVCVDTPWQCHLDTWSEHYKSTPIYKFGDINLNKALEKDDYVIFDGWAEHITDDFASQFDICVSNCSFEHISNLCINLNKIHLALKKDGIFYTKFAPIWSSYAGSHFWVNDEFNFWNKKDIPDFAHLLLSYDEIYNIVLKFVDTNEAAHSLANQIKNGNGVSCYFFEDYVECLKQCNFEKSSIVPYENHKIDEKLRKKLEDKYPRSKRFEVYGVEIMSIK